MAKKRVFTSSGCDHDDRQDLFNEIEEGKEYPPNEKWYSHLLDQYKLYVEMADRISQRRATANSYLLAVNSAILAFAGYLTPKDTTTDLWLLALAGIALAYLWHALIVNYGNLNTAKWQVVHQIEARLPISPYNAEWEFMGRGKDLKLYRPISHIERGVPLIFMALHAIVFAKTFDWCYLTILREPPWPGCMFH